MFIKAWPYAWVVMNTKCECTYEGHNPKKFPKLTVNFIIRLYLSLYINRKWTYYHYKAFNVFFFSFFQIRICQFPLTVGWYLLNRKNQTRVGKESCTEGHTGCQWLTWETTWSSCSSISSSLSSIWWDLKIIYTCCLPLFTPVFKVLILILQINPVTLKVATKP